MLKTAFGKDLILYFIKCVPHFEDCEHEWELSQTFTVFSSWPDVSDAVAYDGFCHENMTLCPIGDPPNFSTYSHYKIQVPVEIN